MKGSWKYIALIPVLLLLNYSAVAQDFEVFPAEVNTSYDEYAPSMMGDKLIFCSNRKADLINTVVDSSDTFMTNVFESKIKDYKLRNPKLLSEWRRPEFHEGPTSWNPHEERFYFTSSMKAPGKRKRDGRFKTVLGIYYVVIQKGDAYVRPRPFPWNSEGEFNVAHPTISEDGEKLVFVSDQSGSSDLYLCDKTRSGWSRPVRLPDFVNTDGREMFPSFFDGKLFFASDGRSDSRGMDIYYSVWKNGNWQKPIRLKEPINSEFNDFGIAFMDDEHGFFSSNRSGESDDLFRFAPIDPTFENCNEIQQPTFCYLVEEQAMRRNDTLPIVFEWDLGDGTTKRGLTVEHCYADTGYYQLSLNVRDTITGNVYTGVSELELLIERKNQPYISSSDTIAAGEEMLFVAEDDHMSGFEVEKYFWDFPGEGKMLRTDSVTWKFKEPGIHRVNLGVLSTIDEEGEREKLCVYKEIVVLEGEVEEEPMTLKMISLDSVMNMEAFVEAFSNNLKLSQDSIAISLNDTSKSKMMVFMTDSTLIAHNEKLSQLMAVEFLGKDDLNEETKENLNYLIMLLREHPQLGLVIESYYQQTSEGKDKDDISLYKALTIQNYFALLGIPKERTKAVGLEEPMLNGQAESEAGFTQLSICRVDKIKDTDDE